MVIRFNQCSSIWVDAVLKWSRSNKALIQFKQMMFYACIIYFFQKNPLCFSLRHSPMLQWCQSNKAITQLSNDFLYVYNVMFQPKTQSSSSVPKSTSSMTIPISSPSPLSDDLPHPGGDHRPLIPRPSFTQSEHSQHSQEMERRLEDLTR